MPTFTDPTPDMNNNDIHTEAIVQQWKDNIDFLFRPPRCRVYHTVNQSPGAGGVLVFNSELFDPDGLHSIVSNTSRITVAVSGIYLITAQVNPNSFLQMSFRLNGTTVIGAHNVTAASAETMFEITASLVANDYVEIVAGSAVTFTATATHSPNFGVAWLGGPP